MHPATVHQTTAKAPDSGMKLGFADITTTGNASLASLQNTPSRPRQSLAKTNISPTFQFKFNHESSLSEQGRQLMESIQLDAARIKEQMRAEIKRNAQENMQGQDSTEHATGRRIAQAVAKSGRFSDVHMAQFKKMDSIENHASSFRARPGFNRPTTGSLKRSSSKADLDEPERPRTAGKSSAVQIPPPVIGRTGSTSPFKSISTNVPKYEDDVSKRLRRDGDSDVSSSRPTVLPRPVSSRLLSPTKASTARVAEASSTPAKSSAIPRSNSVKSVRSVSRPATASLSSTTKLPQPQLNKPLPAPPTEEPGSPTRNLSIQASSNPVPASPTKKAHTSRLPTMESLKSILRSPRKGESTHLANTPKQSSNIPVPMSSQRKVDFTPSVKSRYAVKLAEGSPSPAKVDRSRPLDRFEPAIPYDSSAFIIPGYNEDYDDDDSDVVYPTLPALSPRPGSASEAFSSKAKQLSRRESKEFKSIFTTIQKDPSKSLTSVNTNVNRTDPLTNASHVAQSPMKAQPSPSTIRRIRNSELVQPFEDSINTVPHGIPGKKRRMQSEIVNDKFGRDDDAKENRRMSHQSSMPGTWDEDTTKVATDEGEQRGGKRARLEENEDLAKERAGSPVKKSAAREAAARNAKDRKSKTLNSRPSTGRGVLSASRLNMLARPKNRG